MTQEANAKFRAFFDQGSYFAGVMTLDGIVIESNRIALDACGFTRAQVIGRPFWDCPWWSPSPALVTMIQEATREAAAGRPFRRETPYFVADGSERMVDLILAPVLDDDGHVIFLAPTGTDITDKTRAEADLRRSAADLAEANRRTNEFLAMLAHELRNPLAAIRNALQVVRSGGDGPAAIASASGIMERQLQQLVRLVDDLLDVSRMSRGRIVLQRERVPLAAAIGDAVDMLRPTALAKQQILDVTLPAGPVDLDADPIRLAQILGNVLGNASKFTPSGGRIAVAAAPDTARGKPAEVVIRVDDSGIGIAADQLQSIFELFAQVDVSLERTQTGLGIGLTLVKQLTELHGGTVDVASAGIDRGSTFVVRLPRWHDAGDPASAKPPEAPRPEHPAASVHRVLLVDDNADAAEALAMLLELDGHTTRIAHDGLEAVSAAAEFTPDVVLLDIGLPKQNGYEAARQIRAGAHGAGMLLVALTGWGQSEDRQRSAEAGFDAHLLKPVDPEALRNLVAGHRAPPA